MNLSRAIEVLVSIDAHSEWTRGITVWHAKELPHIPRAFARNETVQEFEQEGYLEVTDTLRLTEKGRALLALHALTAI